MKTIIQYINEYKSSKSLLFNLLDKTEDYGFTLYAKNYDELKETYNLKELTIGRELKSHPEYIDIYMIKTNEHKSGYGTKIMNDICEWADSRNKILVLTPSDEYGMNINFLKKFYKKFGFVENKGKHTDFLHKQSMHRLPKNIDK